LREHGLTVIRADVATVGEQAMNVFYVRDPSGRPVNPTTIDAVRKEIGQTIMLNVKNVPSNAATPAKAAQEQAESASLAKNNLFSFGSLFGKILKGSNMV
jgi:hypothetical protein